MLIFPITARSFELKDRLTGYFSNDIHAMKCVIPIQCSDVVVHIFCHVLDEVSMCDTGMSVPSNSTAHISNYLASA